MRREAVNTGSWNADIVESNLAYLYLIRQAMLDDPAEAAEAFGFVGIEDRLRTLTFLDDSQLATLANADLLFGCDEADKLDEQLDLATRPGPTEATMDLLVSETGKPLVGWQAERRLFDVQWFLMLRGHVNENPMVAAAVFRLGSPIVIHRLRQLSRKGAHRLARWGGNSRLRKSAALLTNLAMLANGMTGYHLMIAGGAMQTSNRFIDSTALI